MNAYFVIPNAYFVIPNAYFVIPNAYFVIPNAYFVIPNEVRDLHKRMPKIPTPALQALYDKENADYYGLKPS